jgi:hypothetical protein
MLLLFSNPRVGLSLALETGVSAGEGADLIDVDGKRAVRFRDSPIISHASDMVCSQASANRGQAQRSRGSRFKVSGAEIQLRLGVHDHYLVHSQQLERWAIIQAMCASSRSSISGCSCPPIIGGHRVH